MMPGTGCRRFRTRIALVKCMNTQPDQWHKCVKENAKTTQANGRNSEHAPHQGEQSERFPPKARDQRKNDSSENPEQHFGYGEHLMRHGSEYPGVEERLGVISMQFDASHVSDRCWMHVNCCAPVRGFLRPARAD